jgi:hypothetical protein
LIEQQGRERQRIALVLLNRQYLISWLDSGTTDLLTDSGLFDVSVFAPQHVLELLPDETKYEKFRIESIEASRAATHLVAMNWVALRSKSLTFRFSLQRTFRSDYWFFSYQLGFIAGIRQTILNAKTVLWNLRKKRLTVLYFFRPFRILAKRHRSKLGKMNVIPEGIRNGNFDWMFIPCHAIDELMTDYIAEAREIGLKSLVAIDNWDNLTSKSVYVVKPEYLTVMGQKCIEHAKNIHEIQKESVLTFGLPRFDAYRKYELSRPVIAQNLKKRVLYAGFSMAHSEKRVVDAIANYLDERYDAGAIEVHYRPHPIPIPRIDTYEIVNPRVVSSSHGSLPRTGMPSMDSDYMAAMLQADVVVGAPTTLMLEAMLLGRPCVIDLTTDKFHRTTASNAAKHFVHMHDLLAVPDLDAGRTISEIVSAVDALLAKDVESMDYDIDHLYNTADALYGEQLLAFLTAEK